jgi:hypothetical protein
LRRFLITLRRTRRKLSLNFISLLFWHIIEQLNRTFLHLKDSLGINILRMNDTHFVVTRKLIQTNESCLDNIFLVSYKSDLLKYWSDLYPLMHNDKRRKFLKAYNLIFLWTERQETEPLALLCCLIFTVYCHLLSHRRNIVFTVNNIVNFLVKFSAHDAFLVTYVHTLSLSLSLRGNNSISCPQDM